MAYGGIPDGLADKRAVGRYYDALKPHLPAFHLVILGYQLVLHGCVHGVELRVVTDGLQAVPHEEHHAAIGDIYAMGATQDAAHVYSEASAESQFAERLACPQRIGWYIEVGDVYVAVEEMSLEEWAAAAADLCLDVSRAQVLHEESLEPYAAVFEPS